MNSKQLNSILNTVPSATAEKHYKNDVITDDTKSISKQSDKQERIVANITPCLKEQIRQYLKNNRGETEKTLVLKALKKFGFDIDNNIIVDKRTQR